MDSRECFSATPLMHTIGGCSPKVRVVRQLVDAGADTASAVRIAKTPGGMVEFGGFPLDLTISYLRGARGKTSRKSS